MVLMKNALKYKHFKLVVWKDISLYMDYLYMDLEVVFQLILQLSEPCTDCFFLIPAVLKLLYPIVSLLISYHKT